MTEFSIDVGPFNGVVIAADSKTYINSAIDSARGARDAYLKFDVTAASDANGTGGWDAMVTIDTSRLTTW